MPDLDQGSVEADAASDPTLDRPCEEGRDCDDPNCPLQHDDAVLVDLSASGVNFATVAKATHDWPAIDVFNMVAAVLRDHPDLHHHMVDRPWGQVERFQIEPQGFGEPHYRIEMTDDDSYLSADAGDLSNWRPFDDNRPYNL